MEYLYEIIDGLVVGVLIDFIITFFSTSKNKIYHVRINRIIFHHSCFGLLLIILYLFYNYLFILFVGVGIILAHSLRNKSLLFLETKSKKYF